MLASHQDPQHRLRIVSPVPLEQEYQRRESERKRQEEIEKEHLANNPPPNSKSKKPTIESYKNFFFTQKAFDTSIVPRPLVAEVIHEVTYEIKARGVLAPYVLLSFRPESSSEDLQYLINTIFPVGKQPLTGEELLREIRLADVYSLAGVLKWCWCRIPGGVVSWKAYEQFKQEEDETGHKQDSFFTIMPRCVESEFHATIVFDFFDLLASVATHGRKNGLGGRKLSRLAGTWAFDIITANSEEPTSFADGLAAWSIAAEATNHLFTAFLRNLDPVDIPEVPAPPFGRLPKPLEAIARSAPYPPKALYKSRLVAVPMVTLTVGKLSANPLVLLRRIAKTIRFDNPPIFHSEDDFNTLYFLFSDPDAIEHKISPESMRILNEVIQENPITTDHALYIKDTPNQPYDIRGKTWSKFYNHAYIDPVMGDVNRPLTNYIYDDNQMPYVLKAGVPSQEKPTLPYPEDNRHHYYKHNHHHYDPDYGFDKYENPYHNRKKNNADDNLVTASISQIAIDDFFVWVWMSSLSAEQTEIRKATFGRSVVVELEVGPGEAGKRWVVVEEILYPEPAPMKKQSKQNSKEPALDKYKTRRVVSSPPITRPTPQQPTPPPDAPQKKKVKSKKKQSQQSPYSSSVEKHYHHHHPYYYQGLDPALVEAIAKRLQIPQQQSKKRESVAAQTQTYEVAETQTENTDNKNEESTEIREFAEAVAAAIAKNQYPINNGTSNNSESQASLTSPQLVDRGIGPSPSGHGQEEKRPSTGVSHNDSPVASEATIPIATTNALAPPNDDNFDTASIYHTPYMGPSADDGNIQITKTSPSRYETPVILRPSGSPTNSESRRSVSLQNPIRSTLEGSANSDREIGHTKNQGSDISMLKLGEEKQSVPYENSLSRRTSGTNNHNLDKPLPPPPEAQISEDIHTKNDSAAETASISSQQKVKRKPVGSTAGSIHQQQQQPVDRPSLPQDNYYDYYNQRGRKESQDYDHYQQGMINNHGNNNREMSPWREGYYPPPPSNHGYFDNYPPPPGPPPHSAHHQQPPQPVRGGRMRGPPPQLRYRRPESSPNRGGQYPSPGKRSSGYMTDSPYLGSDYGGMGNYPPPPHLQKPPPPTSSQALAPGGMPTSSALGDRIGPKPRYPKKQPMMKGDEEFYQNHSRNMSGPPLPPSSLPNQGRVVSNYERGGKHSMGYYYGGNGYDDGGFPPPPPPPPGMRNNQYSGNVSPKSEYPPPPPPSGNNFGRPYSHSGVGPLPGSPPLPPPNLQERQKRYSGPIPATNETSIDAKTIGKTEPRSNTPFLATHPQRRVASQEALQSPPPPPALNNQPYPRVASPSSGMSTMSLYNEGSSSASQYTDNNNSGMINTERKLGFKTPAEVKAEKEAAVEAEKLADAGVGNSKNTSTMSLSDKPLPLDPKWQEIKENLATMRENNEYHKVPVVIDPEPEHKRASPETGGEPADNYYGSVISTMRRPSVNTGDHVRSILVKDTGDDTPVGDDEEGIVYNSPLFSIDANDYFNSRRSLPLASTLGVDRRHSIIGGEGSAAQKDKEIEARKPSETLQRRNSTGNNNEDDSNNNEEEEEEESKVPTVVPQHDPKAFDPKNELSVFRAAKAGLLDPGSPSKKQEQEDEANKVSKYSIVGIMGAVNNKKKQQQNP